MAEHEPCIGATDDWYTPPDIFDALGLIFDLDPCSPGPAHWVPARKIYTKEDDGLVQPWSGTVFMNPPFGRRNGHVPWLRKFLAHSDGVAIVRAYTSSAWFHQWAVKAQTMCFPRGKTKFIRPDGSIGRAPGHIGEHDRHDTRRLQQQRQGRAAIGQDGVRRKRDQFRRVFAEIVDIASAPAQINLHVAALAPACLLKPSLKYVQPEL